MNIKNKRKRIYKNKFKFIDGEIWVNANGEQYIARNNELHLLSNNGNFDIISHPSPKNFIQLISNYNNDNKK